MATRTLAYECKYCGTLKKTMAVCVRHERTCFQNPNAQNCVLCEHMTQGENGRVCAVSGKRCSVAISAYCADFSRRKSNG